MSTINTFLSNTCWIMHAGESATNPCCATATETTNIPHRLNYQCCGFGSRHSTTAGMACVVATVGCLEGVDQQRAVTQLPEVRLI